MSERRVLVLGTSGPNGLAMCRSLGERDLSVTAGGTTRYLPGMLSKYTDDAYVHPDPMDDWTAFVDHLEALLADEDFEAVFPVTDLTTSLLSRAKDRLEATGTLVGTEDWERFRRANDKARLFEFAAGLDVPTPATYAPETLSDVAAVDDERDGTVVVKPRRTTHVAEDGGCFTQRLAGDNYVDPAADLRERYRRLLAEEPSLAAEYPIVQAYVEGDGTVATVGLADDGELLLTFQHEKFRVYPPSGGIGAVRKGIREPRMERYAERIVEALGWTGPIHVEFMRTQADDFALLEVNGRYWGSLALTINSGIDVPWHHYRLLRPERDGPRGERAYRTDLKQRKLFYQDIRWLREQLSRGNVAALAPFLTSFATTNDEFLTADDPWPLLGLGPRTLRIVRNRLEGKSQY